MKIVLIGIQGAGKSTQGNLLAEKLNVPYLSTGHIFRELAKKKTKIGRYIKEVMNAGYLMPDKKTVVIVDEYLKRQEYKSGYIIDGFPRTIHQAKFFRDGANKVISFQNTTYMLVNEAVQGSDKSTIFVAPPEIGLFANNNPSPEVLLVGLGRGELVDRYHSYASNIDIVEINPEIVEMAKKFFGFNYNYSIYTQDGRYYITHSKKKYDIIVLDAYRGQVLPAHMVTVEMFEATKKLLNPDGILIMNVAMGGYENNTYEKALYKTLKINFPNTLLISRNGADILIIASEKNIDKNGIIKNVNSRCHKFCDEIRYNLNNTIELDTKESQAFTDNYNSHYTLEIRALEDSRNQTLNKFGRRIFLS